MDLDGVSDKVGGFRRRRSGWTWMECQIRLVASGGDGRGGLGWSVR